MAQDRKDALTFKFLFMVAYDILRGGQNRTYSLANLYILRQRTEERERERVCVCVCVEPIRPKTDDQINKSHMTEYYYSVVRFWSNGLH